MYHAFLALYPHVRRRLGFSCINISVPGGAIGVASKWYSPCIAAHADSNGFCLHLHMMLTLRSICGHIRHQRKMGKSFGSDAREDFLHYFHVWMALSAGFVLCISGGVYWMAVCWLAMNSSTSFEVSLSSLCSFGLKPRCWHQEYTSS